MIRCSSLLLLFLFALSLILNVAGITWGLPSAPRTQFYPQDPQWYEVNETTNRLYVTTPWASYHPDEGYLLLGLSKMNPGALDFNPHGFLYPTLHIYLTGAAVKAAGLLGYGRVEGSKYFYLSNPDEIARIYLVGRMLAAVISACGVVLLYFLARRLFGEATGILSALSLVLMPLWVRDSHFMVVNVPSAVWMIASALLAVLAIQRSSSPTLIGSAFVAGLAASTKYPAGMVFVLVIYAFLEGRFGGSWRGKVGLLMTLPVLFLAGFLVGTPYALLSPDEFSRDLRTQSELFGLPTVQLILSQAIIAEGLVLAVVTAIGLLLAGFRLADWRYRFILIWVAGGIAQRFLSQADFIRYLITALPALAICAGIALNALRGYLVHRLPRYGQAAGAAAALILLVPAAAYSLNVDMLMAGDTTNDIAASWIDRNVAANQVVGIFGALYFDMPPINAEKYQVVNLSGENPTVQPSVVVASTLSTASAAAWLERTRWLTSGAPQTQVFRHRPAPGWTWPVATWPQDWTYTFPEISIWWK
jgi:hypothetical protein